MFEEDGREAEALKIMKTYALNPLYAFFPGGNLISWHLQQSYDELRDWFLFHETTWDLTDAERRPKFHEFEACFPFKEAFPNDTIANHLRRVSSWYLASASPRLYNGFVDGQREVDFRDLRGESNIDSTETTELAGPEPAEPTS